MPSDQHRSGAKTVAQGTGSSSQDQQRSHATAQQQQHQHQQQQQQQKHPHQQSFAQSQQHQYGHNPSGPFLQSQTYMGYPAQAGYPPPYTMAPSQSPVHAPVLSPPHFTFTHAHFTPGIMTSSPASQQFEQHHPHPPTSASHDGQTFHAHSPQYGPVYAASPVTQSFYSPVAYAHAPHPSPFGMSPASPFGGPQYAQPQQGDGKGTWWYFPHAPQHQSQSQQSQHQHGTPAFDPHTHTFAGSPSSSFGPSPSFGHSYGQQSFATVTPIPLATDSSVTSSTAGTSAVAPSGSSVQAPSSPFSTAGSSLYPPPTSPLAGVYSPSSPHHSPARMKTPLHVQTPRSPRSPLTRTSPRSPAIAASSKLHPTAPRQSPLVSTTLRAGTTVQSPSSPKARNSHHPALPATRSEWVMWVGNVPSDAREDELLSFFCSVPVPAAGLAVPSPGSSSAGSSSTAHSTNTARQSPAQPFATTITSIFLIARSNCAFVNFSTSSALQLAVQLFNGLSLRPNDPRCPRLVCRVRKRDDDLRAGVGGQRGTGVHTRWVKDQARQRDQSSASDVGNEVGDGPLVDPRAGDAERPGPFTHPPKQTHTPHGDHVRLGQNPEIIQNGDGGSGSGESHESTNSGFLTKHFPKRYFIMKSLTEEQLVLSVSCSLWSTQRHNEGILDQAYRTSKDVFLIFSANKSGEFFGYARMAGAIHPRANEQTTPATVNWQTRADALNHMSPTATRRPPLADVQEDAEPEESSTQTESTRVDPVPEMHKAASDPRPRHQADELPQRTAASTGDAKAILAASSSLLPTPGSARDGHVLSPDHRIATSPSPLQEKDMDELFPARQGEPQSAFDMSYTRPALSAPPTIGPRNPLSFDARKGADTMDDKSRPRDEQASAEDIAFDPGPSGSSSGTPSAHFAFRLDPNAAHKAVRERETLGRTIPSVTEPSLVLEIPAETAIPAAAAGGTLARPPAQGEAATAAEEDSWGSPFKIEWISTTRLPFPRTRHLRNPWNHDREIKVSRDGTEIEPTVGAQLLAEWDRPPPPPEASIATAETTAQPQAGASSRRGAKSRGKPQAAAGASVTAVS